MSPHKRFGHDECVQGLEPEGLIEEAKCGIKHSYSFLLIC